MQKSKPPKLTRKHPVRVAHKNNDLMDKIKIKRVKRNKKKTTTSEKVLAGIGLGSSLLGGASAVTPKTTQTQFVRTQNTEQSTAKSKIQNTLKNIFNSTFGVQAAKADSGHWFTSADTGETTWVSDDAGNNTNQDTTPQDSGGQNNNDSNGQIATLDEYYQHEAELANQQAQQAGALTHTMTAVYTADDMKGTGMENLAVPSNNHTKDAPPAGVKEGDVNPNDPTLVWHITNGVGQWTSGVTLMGNNTYTGFTSTHTTNPDGSTTITLNDANHTSITYTNHDDFAAKVAQYNTRFADDQQLAGSFASAFNILTAQNTPKQTSGSGAAYNMNAAASNFSPGFQDWLAQNYPKMSTSPEPTDVAAVQALNNKQIEFENFVSQEQSDNNYMQAYNNWLLSFQSGKVSADSAPKKPDGFDQRHPVGTAGVVTVSATHDLPPALGFSTNGNVNAPQVGDAWQVTVHGSVGDIVWATDSAGNKTPMGTIGADGNFVVRGTFSASDLADGKPTQWNETWTVGQSPDTAVQAGKLNFTLNPYGVTAGTIASVGGDYSSTVKSNSDGTFTVTLNDANHTTVTASNIEDFNQKIQTFNVTGNSGSQNIFASLAQASNQIRAQVAAASATPNNATGFTPHFQQNVVGNGPDGTYPLNTAYYADQATADWLAKTFGGTVVSVNVTSDWQRFSYPPQLFIQFPDGSKINAGQFATYAFTNPGALAKDLPADVYGKLSAGLGKAIQSTSGSGAQLTFTNATGLNANSLNVGDSWAITVTGTDGARVYATDVQGNRTYMGTISGGVLNLSGKITAGQVGQWAEKWTVGTDTGDTGTIGNVSFLVNTPTTSTQLISGDPTARGSSTIINGDKSGNTPTGLKFTNTTSGNANALNVGDVWSLEVYGPKGAPVYAQTDGIAGNQLMGYIGDDGKFVLKGTITDKQTGIWNEHWTIGTGASASAVGNLNFTVSPGQSTGALTPTFLSNVKGNGPAGTYNLNSAYYADDATAKWLSSQIPGSRVVSVTPNMGGNFTWPAQNYIVLSDGTYINAGELATSYISAGDTVNSTTGIALNTQRLQQTVAGEQSTHKASTGDVTPDGVKVVSWSYDPIEGYVGVDSQGRYVKIQDGKWGVSESLGATATWLSLGSSGPAQVAGFTLTKQSQDLYGVVKTVGGNTGAAAATSTAIQTMSISALSSTSVTPGGSLTIIGSNFGATVSANTVEFISGNIVLPAAIVSANSGSITVTAPMTLTVGATYNVRVRLSADATKVSNTLSVLVTGSRNASGSGTTGTSAASGTGAELVSAAIVDPVVTGGANGNLATVSVADQKTIHLLQQQVTDLQARLSSVLSTGSQNSDLTHQVAVLQSQIQGLQNTIGSLQRVSSTGSTGNIVSAQASNLQAANLTAQVAGVSTFQGLQMPPGFPASGNNGQGLQMPDGYPGSNTPVAEQIPVSQKTQGTYTVKKGDTLWDISKKVYGDGSKWRKILSANPKALGVAGNTKTLKIGTQLVIPVITK